MNVLVHNRVQYHKRWRGYMQLDLALHNKRNQKKKKAEKVDNNIHYTDKKIET